MPHIQSIRCQHHFVIYINESTPIVIAILHERTNWITNLRKRLGGK